MTLNRGAQRAMIAVFFSVVALVYAVAWSLPAVGLDHDDAACLITAKAIAAGHGYMIESLPTPIPPDELPAAFSGRAGVIYHRVGADVVAQASAAGMHSRMAGTDACAAAENGRIEKRGTAAGGIDGRIANSCFSEYEPAAGIPIRPSCHGGTADAA